jgi:Zn-dependent peptidase ImmA (M78 family)
MSEPPEEPRLRAEFRSLPDADLDHLSRNTMLLLRKARAFQAALIELYGDRNPVPVPIWRQARLNPRNNVVEQAAHVREALRVDADDVRQQPDADAALKLWRRAVEGGGVHVFKDTFKQREFSGFCLWHPEFPVILINNSTTKTRQVFSLVHELAHVLCDRSGISRFDDRGIEDLPPLDRAIERFCNAISAEILVPTADFEAAASEIDPENATDQQFSAVAGRFHVSRSVILRRFLDRGDVTLDRYLAKDREWADQQQKQDSKGGSYYTTQGAYVSEQFLREVVSRYSRRLRRAGGRPAGDCGPARLARGFPRFSKGHYAGVEQPQAQALPGLGYGRPGQCPAQLPSSFLSGLSASRSLSSAPNSSSSSSRSQTGTAVRIWTTGRPCADRTSTCLSFATISSGLCLFWGIPTPSVTKAIKRHGWRVPRGQSGMNVDPGLGRGRVRRPQLPQPHPLSPHRKLTQEDRKKTTTGWVI